MIQGIITLISILALLGLIALVILLLVFLADRILHKNIFDRIVKPFRPHAYILAFGLSLIATLSSLFLSEIAHLQPCILCWYQRIMMYPQPILYFVAILRKERVLRPYVIVLSSIGSVVSLYHYSLHVLPHNDLLMPCSQIYAGVPCDKGYTKFFGFMTFPLMAFVVFALLIVLMLISDREKNTARTKKRR